MNKIIPSEDRVFMSMVGPAASGESHLIFRKKLKKKRTFIPAFANIFYFYQYLQKLYAEMQKEVRNIEFNGSLDFDLIENLPNDGTNYLLVFDDSCDEISRSKQFEKIAIAGTHRKLNCIYIKNILFHKSANATDTEMRNMRDNELQNTHIVLFKSPPYVQQIDVPGKQHGLGNTQWKWYADATSIPYGYPMIDLSPKTNDILRYSTEVTSFPTNFYSPSSRSRITQINDQKSGLL